jgi:hypothetical protein
MNITLFGSNKKPQYILHGLRSCNPCSYFISNRKKNSNLEIYGKKKYFLQISTAFYQQQYYKQTKKINFEKLF